MVNLEGKTVLVTGSADGVGRVVAQRLAAARARVLIHGRDIEKGHRAVADISKAAGTARFLATDAEVRRLADTVRAHERRLDILINNAGIGAAGMTRQTSADGHELRFAVNYLAGFLLTRLLLPLILASTPARIVNVSSAGQQALDFDDVMLTCAYSGQRAYCRSKLAQIMFTIDLAQDALHPATYMNTAMVRRASVTPVSSVEEGAEAILNLAASPDLAGIGGRYFNGLRETRANRQAYDEKARERLMQISLELTAGYR